MLNASVNKILADSKINLTDELVKYDIHKLIAT